MRSCDLLYANVQRQTSKNVSQEGYNALHVAILHGHLPVVKYFLNSGVDANQKTKVQQRGIDRHS
jgi:ankyrin repeat protein